MLSENGRKFAGKAVTLEHAVLRNLTSRAPRQPEAGFVMTTHDKAPSRKYVYKIFRSPVGRLKLVASDRGLSAILWENDDPRRVRLNIVAEEKMNSILVMAELQLGEYFAGERTTFDVPLDFAGTTFQQKVWRALLTIPFGETRSYGQIAKQIRNPAAVRAVGAANGRNPIGIIAPCHRVIGANGKLTGFAGGLETKARLLTLEGVAGAGAQKEWVFRE
jgi:methylated-DNA-[protein]-cysteine S-methyltransferase